MHCGEKIKKKMLMIFIGFEEKNKKYKTKSYHTATSHSVSSTPTKTITAPIELDGVVLAQECKA